MITLISFTLTIAYAFGISLEKPSSASSFPEVAPHSIGIIFREENEAKVPPGAAFGDPMREADEGLRSLVRKERVVGPARGPTEIWRC